MKTADLLKQAGKPFFYYSEVAKKLNNPRDAVFLCHLLNSMQEDAESQDGWICKTLADTYEATGLSRWEQETARRNLKRLGILEEKYKGLPRKLYFRVNLEKLSSLLST